MEPAAITAFTEHARTRLRQRGITTSVAELLLEYGDIHRHAGDGAETISMSRDAAAMLLAEGVNADAVARARKLAAVLGKYGLVTVLRPSGRGGRCYRRQCATRNRRAA